MVVYKKIVEYFLIASTLCVLWASDALAEIHKCKTPTGTVYSDKPCQTGETSQSVSGNINYENSAAGRRDSLIRHLQANQREVQALDKKCAQGLEEYKQHKYSGGQVDLRWLEAKKRELILECGIDPVGRVSTPGGGGPGRDIGQCMGYCASEQGMCIANCRGNGPCIGNCGASHGRCVAACN